MGKEAEIGDGSPGKKADLVVLDRDPLADISNIRSTWAVYHHQTWITV